MQLKLHGAEAPPEPEVSFELIRHSKVSLSLVAHHNGDQNTLIDISVTPGEDPKVYLRTRTLGRGFEDIIKTDADRRPVIGKAGWGK